MNKKIKVINNIAVIHPEREREGGEVGSSSRKAIRSLVPDRCRKYDPKHFQAVHQSS
jgi:hypothetical protein